MPNGSLGTPLPQITGPDLNKSFQRLRTSMAKTLPGQVGIAITPVGGDVPTTFGSLKVARAWSTLKVPVSIAAERAGGTSTRPTIAKAIRASDNDAAASLWDSMGNSANAVQQVTAVLREGHDLATRVSSELDRPRSYPGYTPWTLADQSVFAAHLPCMPSAATELRFMNQVDGNQQWGVARPADRTVTSAVKGGWGPASDASGKYVVRQLGVITTARGQYGVSLAALPASGSFGDGKAMVTRLGKWLLTSLNSLQAGTCPAAPVAEPDKAPPTMATP
ncbi:MAG: hypothetical protein QM658_15700 [Gordonia sp. (in: high G+C Gram-positive bacteria)]